MKASLFVLLCWATPGCQTFSLTHEEWVRQQRATKADHAITTAGPEHR